MYEAQYSKENRCRRCSRELMDESAQYGWRCAEKMGVSFNKHFGEKGSSQKKTNNFQSITSKIVNASDWDDEHLNDTGKMLIEYFKKQWRASYLSGDIEGMKKAHENAIEIRQPYLVYGEIISPDGNVINLKNENVMYNTPDDAAMSFVYYNNPKTHEENRERGGYIYEIKISGKTNYFFKEDLPKGLHDTVIFNAFSISGKELTLTPPFAFVHTHPHCNGHDGDDFSGPDTWLVTIMGMKKVYLGTPEGQLYSYSKEDPYKLISSYMPKTKKAKFTCIKQHKSK